MRGPMTQHMVRCVATHSWASTLGKLRVFNGRLKKVRRDQKSRQHKVRASGRQCEAHREFFEVISGYISRRCPGAVSRQVNSHRTLFVVQHVIPKADLSPFWSSSMHFRVSELKMQRACFIHAYEQIVQNGSCVFFVFLSCDGTYGQSDRSTRCMHCHKGRSGRSSLARSTLTSPRAVVSKRNTKNNFCPQTVLSRTCFSTLYV